MIQPHAVAVLRGRRGGAGLASRRQRHRHCVGWAGRPRRGRGLRARRGHPHAGLDRLRRALRRDRRARRGRRRPVVGHDPPAVRRGSQLVAPGRVAAARAVGRRCGRRRARPTPGSRRCWRRPTPSPRARSAGPSSSPATRCCPAPARRSSPSAARPPTAVLLGPDEDGAPAVLGPRASRWMAALDRYRGDHEDTTRDVYDGRLFREEIFLPLAAETAAALGTDSRWSLPDPDGRLGSALARKIGMPTRWSSADVRRAPRRHRRGRRAHRPRARPRRTGRRRRSSPSAAAGPPRWASRSARRCRGRRGRSPTSRPRALAASYAAGAPGPRPARTGRRARRDGRAAGQRDVRAGQRRDPRAHRRPLRRLRHRRRSRRRSTRRASPAAATSSTRCRSPARARSRPS